ncbi:hypothetical protein B0G75_13144 [Paraburkholderia sp. BL18I3N2]|uniref:hypothetical protein n=1 Tax=Paraburkholderia sp. BL18I3N2 TaxID=1938799 RepID=UPI000D04E5B7|nr:hypothetical protein [Paraburkholderia sp. BL18I3N2]PRX21187.1 hypothetical protein B0G75_13144 [Paraburkholderia sp. BL18I3N2]
MTKISVPTVCLECNPDGSSVANSVLSSVLLDLRSDGDGRYRSECSRGHQQIVALRQQKFEILFELAAYAIRDGHYRQSVSSCTASLEAFHEFFLRAMAYQSGIRKERFDAAWKLLGISPQNRQEAYLLNYRNFCARPPVLLSPLQIAWKDSVMQKGKMPKREECVTFGQAVLHVLQTAMGDAKDAFPNGVKQAMQEYVTAAQQRASTSEAPWSIRTIVNLGMEGDEHSNTTLEAALARIS